jgi:peptidoglycan/LPS O-acetylase OafA/YrhL
LEYRREIDGLRALAVVPVVLFHGNFKIFQGGFAGVDVFFVISGYLITSIIYNEILNGDFSIVAFYERRIRRIAPALLFVSIVCLPFAWLWMLPGELNDFGKSLYHVNLFVSNFLFWKETGYFSPSNALKPLLHTWSLSVEEQFYLFFPLVLLAMRRATNRTRICVITCLTLASFVLTQIVPRYDPTANFYLLPTRFWELGAGCLLALHQSHNRRIDNPHSAVLAMLGLALIVATYLFVSEGDYYPGWETVGVVIGTVLVLAYAGPENFVGRLLGRAPFVLIGLVSYSLYLWHQPLFALWGLRSLGGLTSQDYMLLILVALGLAFLTYRFVETPFRNRRLFGRKAIFGVCTSLGVVLIVTGAVTDHLDGFTFRFPQVADANARAWGLGRKCEDAAIPACATSDAPEMAIWGDSFARHLVNGVMASRPDARLVQLTKSKCAPFVAMTWIPDGESAAWPSECLQNNSDIMNYIANTASLKYVVLSSPFINSMLAPEVLMANGSHTTGGYDLVRQNMIDTLNQIQSRGVQPVVFAPPPRNGIDKGICVARALKIGVSSSQCRIDARESLAYDRLVIRLMHDVSKLYPVLDMRPYLCDREKCNVEDMGVPLYENEGHLSANGSERLGKALDFYGAIQSAATFGCASQDAFSPGKPHGICSLHPGTPDLVSPLHSDGGSVFLQ